MAKEKEIFKRAELLMGEDVMEALASKRVIVFGVGGVGSWCVECLVRSGIRHITIVNPDCEVNALQKMYTDETAAEFHLEEYDYIIDAIDSLKDKISLIMRACETNAVFFSSMGAALKMDSMQIRVTEFWKVRGCPLGSALRKRMKRAGLKPAHKFQCVYSEELLDNRGSDTGNDPCLIQKAQTNGSMAHITAIFGFTIAGLVLKDVYQKTLGKL